VPACDSVAGTAMPRANAVLRNHRISKAESRPAAAASPTPMARCVQAATSRGVLGRARAAGSGARVSWYRPLMVRGETPWSMRTCVRPHSKVDSRKVWVCNLRKKLKPHGYSVHNIHGLGYQLVEIAA